MSIGRDILLKRNLSALCQRALEELFDTGITRTSGRHISKVSGEIDEWEEIVKICKQIEAEEELDEDFLVQAGTDIFRLLYELLKRYHQIEKLDFYLFEDLDTEEWKDFGIEFKDIVLKIEAQLRNQKFSDIMVLSLEQVGDILLSQSMFFKISSIVFDNRESILQAFIDIGKHKTVSVRVRGKSESFSYVQLDKNDIEGLGYFQGTQVEKLVYTSNQKIYIQLRTSRSSTDVYFIDEDGAFMYYENSQYGMQLCKRANTLAKTLL